MKKQIYSAAGMMIMLLLSMGLTLGAQEARKETSKSFDVNKGVTLISDTRYTDVEMLTWDKNVIDVLAEIEVNASSKGKAEEKLQKIRVEVKKTANTVSVETDFDEGWSKNAKVDIHITIKAPSYINLELESAYGDVFFQEVMGLAMMDIQYGNLKAGKLGRGNEKPYNSLELAYSDANIETAGWLDIDLAYSELEIGTSGMLFVESKYSKLEGEKVGGIITEGAYDKYYFDEVGSFVAELRYSGIKFGSLSKKFNVESKYTNMKIAHLSKNFKEVSVVASYGNIYMDVEEGASFKIDAIARYGNITMPFEGKLSHMKENNTKKTWGNIGSSPKAQMNLETRYGNITLE